MSDNDPIVVEPVAAADVIAASLLCGFGFLLMLR